MCLLAVSRDVDLPPRSSMGEGCERLLVSVTGETISFVWNVARLSGVGVANEMVAF